MMIVIAICSVIAAIGPTAPRIVGIMIVVVVIGHVAKTVSLSFEELFNFLINGI